MIVQAIQIRVNANNVVFGVPPFSAIPHQHPDGIWPEDGFAIRKIELFLYMPTIIFWGILSDESIHCGLFSEEPFMLSATLSLEVNDLPARARALDENAAEAMFGGFWRKIRRAVTRKVNSFTRDVKTMGNQIKSGNIAGAVRTGGNMYLDHKYGAKVGAFNMVAGTKFSARVL